MGTCLYVDQETAEMGGSAQPVSFVCCVQNTIRDQKFQAITELNKENNKKVSRRTVQYSIRFIVREAGIEIPQMSLNTYQYTHVLLTYCMSKETPLAGRRRLEVSNME